ncbi:MAG: hypothetical protein JF606_13965 [Burkholderiales bacterium]|nr:hypothetical protein [Burkholderiales bacterium]
MQRHLLITTIVALLALACAAVQAAALAEPLDMDPAILSKLALERARSRGQASAVAREGATVASDGLRDPADCGNVNIGNVVTGGKPGFQPREITVVITGDVINANNKCK